MRRVRWYSNGAASAVATKLDLVANPGGVVVLCDTRSEHPDNERFRAECETWFGQKIIVLGSEEYRDTFHVWEKERWISGPEGAKCTGVLKAALRIEFQRPDDVHIFGYTADKPDVKRAENFRLNNFELTVVTPLIERGLDKSACLGMLMGAGIAPPVLYGLGFHNNNCIPCGKATSPNYWAAMRLHFPEQFARTAAIARDLGARLAIIGREKQEHGPPKNVRVFIDDIPADWPTLNPISPSCDFLCHLAELDLA